MTHDSLSITVSLVLPESPNPLNYSLILMRFVNNSPISLQTANPVMMVPRGFVYLSGSKGHCLNLVAKGSWKHFHVEMYLQKNDDLP